MSCYSCGTGLHVECTSISESKCCCKSSPPVAEKEEVDDDINWRKKGSSNKGKRDAALKDQQSTGRKRAARLYPLDSEAACEWQGLREAGGGQHPIIVCINGKQQARHHGPDKNTLNNDEGNVHRICHSCHNRWHSRNDEGYEWGTIYTPHNETLRATELELIHNEKYFSENKPPVIKGA